MIGCGDCGLPQYITCIARDCTDDHERHIDGLR